MGNERINIGMLEKASRRRNCWKTKTWRRGDGKDDRMTRGEMKQYQGKSYQEIDDRPTSNIIKSLTQSITYQEIGVAQANDSLDNTKSITHGKAGAPIPQEGELQVEQWYWKEMLEKMCMTCAYAPCVMFRGKYGMKNKGVEVQKGGGRWLRQSGWTPGGWRINFNE